MTSLAENFDPKNNGIGILRHVLALTVAFAHSFYFGGFGLDPLEAAGTVPVSVLAVQSFFAISGFLTAASADRSKTRTSFLSRRALRLFPGFWTCLLLTAFVLAPLLSRSLTQAQIAAYGYASGSPVGYVLSNFFLRINQQKIVGLFAHNPDPTVNAPLWSLFPEMLCYLAMAITVGLRGVRIRRVCFPLLGALALMVQMNQNSIAAHFAGTGFYWKAWYLFKLNQLFACYVIGAGFWVWREKIPASWAACSIAVAALALLIVCKGYAFGGPLFLTTAVLALATRIPEWKATRSTDLSYGIYIYHNPIQQILLDLGVAPGSPYGLFALGTILTLPLAWLSWTLVEKPCMALRTRGKETE